MVARGETAHLNIPPGDERWTIERHVMDVS